jgi:hypothetical protein
MAPAHSLEVISQPGSPIDDLKSPKVSRGLAPPEKLSNRDSVRPAYAPQSLVPTMTNRQKLHKSARRYDIPLVNYIHPVQLRNDLHPPRGHVSNKDKKAAELLLLAQRAADPNYKPPSGLKRTFSRPKPTDPPVFDYNEVNRGLDAAVISEASVGVVKALLLLGGNVNIIRQVPVSLVKKFSKRVRLASAATSCARLLHIVCLGW